MNPSDCSESEAELGPGIAGRSLSNQRTLVASVEFDQSVLAKPIQRVSTQPEHPGETLELGSIPSAIDRQQQGSRDAVEVMIVTFEEVEGKVRDHWPGKRLRRCHRQKEGSRPATLRRRYDHLMTTERSTSSRTVFHEFNHPELDKPRAQTARPGRA